MIKLPPFCIGIKKRIIIDMREYCIFFCPRLTAIHSIFGHHADWTFKKRIIINFYMIFVSFLLTVDFSIIYKKTKKDEFVCDARFFFFEQKSIGITIFVSLHGATSLLTFFCVYNRKWRSATQICAEYLFVVVFFLTKKTGEILSKVSVWRLHKSMADVCTYYRSFTTKKILHAFYFGFVAPVPTMAYLSAQKQMWV